MEYIELTEEQRNSIAQTLAQEIVDRDLTAAAIFLLEAGRPFSFLGSQLMVFAEARAKRAEEKRKWKAEVKAGKLSFWERLWGKRRYEKRPNQSLLDILNRLEEDKRREEKAASIPEGESGDQKPNSTQ
jgi:hypothetical protein